MTINYCVISGTVLDGAGSPVPNASIVFDSLTPQVVNGQYIQASVVDTLTGDDGVMIPVALAQGLVVQVTVNSAAPFQAVVPPVGTVDFGPFAANSFFLPSIDPTTFAFVEDFAKGANGWTAQTIGGAPTVVQITSEALHPGIVRLTTSAVSGQGGALAATSSPAIQLITGLAALTNWSSAYVFRLSQITACRLIVGLLNDFTTGPSVTYAGVRFDTILGDVNFQFVCSNGGGANKTVVDSLLPADTNFHTLRLTMAVAGTVQFSLDGGAVSEIATNCPTAGLTPALQLLTAAAATKSADLDYASLLVPSLSR